MAKKKVSKKADPNTKALVASEPSHQEAVALLDGEREKLMANLRITKRIKDDEERGLVITFGKAIKALLKEAKTRHKTAVAKVKEVQKEFDNIYKPVIGKLSDDEAFLKHLDMEYLQRKEAQLLKAAERRAEKEAAKGNTEFADDVVERAQVKIEERKVVGKVEGASYRTTWHAEVTDIREVCKAVLAGKLPEDLLVAVPARLGTLARDRREEAEEDGIRYFSKTGSTWRS